MTGKSVFRVCVDARGLHWTEPRYPSLLPRDKRTPRAHTGRRDKIQRERPLAERWWVIFLRAAQSYTGAYSTALLAAILDSVNWSRGSERLRAAFQEPETPKLAYLRFDLAILDDCNRCCSNLSVQVFMTAGNEER